MTDISHQEKESIRKMEAIHTLLQKLTQQDCMLAFSGGVDSSLLLKLASDAARENGNRIYAVLIHTVLHPQGDLETAAGVAAETGADFRVLEVDELKEAGILENPEDRCYLCKKYFFNKCLELAQKLHVSVLMDGTNADDLLMYRPGLRALQELGVSSPLAECGLTKQEVRRFAGQLGISVAERPSAPCLATRFPYGTRLNPEEMHLVEAGETYLKSFGLKNVRIRVYDDLIRLETDEADLPVILKHRVEIREKLHQLGYRYVTLDLDGFRSGSMDLRRAGSA